MINLPLSEKHLKKEKFLKKTTTKVMKNFRLGLFNELLKCSVVRNSKTLSRRIRKAVENIKKTKRIPRKVLQAVRRASRRASKPNKAKTLLKPKKALKKKVKISFGHRKSRKHKKAKKHKKISRKTRKNLKETCKKIEESQES